MEKEETNAKIVSLTLTGNIPSKKNSKIMVCRGRYPVLLPSKKHRDWHIQACNQIHSQKPQNALGQEFPVKSTTALSITFYPQNKRLYDLTNKTESVLDLLVDTGILQDDNYSVIPKLILDIGEVRKDGGCDIQILI